jgi:hypothetical protein
VRRDSSWRFVLGRPFVWTGRGVVTTSKSAHGYRSTVEKEVKRVSVQTLGRRQGMRGK